MILYVSDRLTHYYPINSDVIRPHGITHAQIFQACRKMFNRYICIHLWLWSHAAYSRNICASFGAVWEVCGGAASTGLAQSVRVCHCSHRTFPPLIFIWGTEPWQTQQRPRWAQAELLSLFSSSLSFSSHSSYSCSSVLEAAVVCSLSSFR